MEHHILKGLSPRVEVNASIVARIAIAPQANVPSGKLLLTTHLYA